MKGKEMSEYKLGNKISQLYAKCNIRIFKFIWNQGTGKWTAISALDCGMPVTLIGESVFARCLSSLKNERIKASKVLKGPSGSASSHVGDVNQFIEDVRQALYASKIISYAQGFMLLRQAAKVCILNVWKVVQWIVKWKKVPINLLIDVFKFQFPFPGFRMEFELWSNRVDVEGRMHYPISIPRKHQRSI